MFWLLHLLMTHALNVGSHHHQVDTLNRWRVAFRVLSVQVFIWIIASRQFSSDKTQLVFKRQTFFQKPVSISVIHKEGLFQSAIDWTLWKWILLSPSILEPQLSLHHVLTPSAGDNLSFQDLFIGFPLTSAAHLSLSVHPPHIFLPPYPKLRFLMVR